MSTDRLDTLSDVALRELVARALDLREAGKQDWAERACEEDPDQLQRVIEAVRAVDALPRCSRSPTRSIRGWGRWWPTATTSYGAWELARWGRCTRRRTAP